MLFPTSPLILIVVILFKSTEIAFCPFSPAFPATPTSEDRAISSSKVQIRAPAQCLESVPYYGLA